MEYWIPPGKAKLFAEIYAQMQANCCAKRREIVKVVCKLMWWDPAFVSIYSQDACIN